MKREYEIFANEYIAGKSKTQAYKTAYPRCKNDNAAANGAKRLMNKSEVKAYIDEKMRQLERETIATQTEILEFLTSVMRGETTEEAFRGVGEGIQEKTTIQVSVKERIKAAELLGKRYIMWTDKQDMTLSVPIFVDDMKDED